MPTAAAAPPDLASLPEVGEPVSAATQAATIKLLRQQLEGLSAHNAALTEQVNAKAGDFDAPAVTVTKVTEWNIKVRAIKPGFYPQRGAIRHRRREVGEEFFIKHMGHFSPDGGGLIGWMELASEPSSIPVEPALTSAPSLIQDPLSMGRETKVMAERVQWPTGGAAKGHVVQPPGVSHPSKDARRTGDDF